jgi:anaerobic magnesium-protoporphyrin IX monomethyl ester cyclase
VSDILFGQSYYLRFDPKLWEAMQPYPPLGTIYAASYLRSHGHDVDLFDAMLAESEQEWVAELDRQKPTYAVIYEDNFNYLSKMCLLRMRHAAFNMIRASRDRGCTVIVAGSDASDHADKYIAEGAHYVLIGEGEYTLAELMAKLTGVSEMNLSDIQGLVYLAADGELTYTPRRPDITDLDSLPFPAWNLVDIPRYQEIWYARHGYYSMNMVTTRGCPFHCNWCAKPIWGQRYNARSPENVAAELKWLKGTFNPDHIWFVDDIMGLKPKWMDRFADQVERDGTRTPFKCLNRADLLLRGNTIEALQRAGADIVWIGAESGSQKVLDAMEKGTKVEQIYESAQRLHEAGIKVGFFLQFGYPGELREDIEKTLQMVRDCRPDDIGMSVSYPLPGTKFYEHVRGEFGVQQNWLDSNDLAMLYKGPFSTAFYRQLHTVLHKEFRARRYANELKGLLRQPQQIRRKHVRHVAGMIKNFATLPIERRRLNALEREPHTGLQSGPPGMGQQAAATPSPQSDWSGKS